MKINPDDPRWTAYVLGELDEQERAAVDRLLESSEEARGLIDELRMATSMLRDELTTDAPPLLNAEQRSAVRRAASGPTRRWWSAPPAWAAGLAAAGLLAFAVTMPSLLRSRQDAPAESAQTAPASQPESPAPASGPASLDTAVVISSPEPGRSPEPSPAVAAPAMRSEAAAVGILSGIIRDVTGALIPMVTVTATDVRTGVAVSVLTDETGVYRFQNLQPGRSYRVTAELPGFQTQTYSQVEPGQGGLQAQLNFVLPVGSLAQSVEVTAKTETLLATTSASVGPAAADTAVAVQTRPLSGVLGGVLRTEGQASAAPPPPPPPSSPVAINRFSVAAEGAANREFDRTAEARRDGIGRPQPGAESYDRITDNPFVGVNQNPLATLSIDVDTASYANVRRFLSQNQLPPRDAVRIEELINYFNYDYAQPTGAHPIATHIDVASAPWNPQHRLVRVGIKGKEIDMDRRPPSNLVFLIDVSGSMAPAEKLPLLKSGMKLLVDRLGENDRVSMVVYAGASGIVLPPTGGNRKEVILQALENLHAGGSTNGASGIELAYNTAVSNFIRGGVNRVILATDGDFNVGITSPGALTRLIEEKARSGVFLSVLGFGMGNLKDSTLEQLADTGNGHYAYVDTLNEARKVLVEEMGGTLITIAKDVKIQVEFNPAQVSSYRLIGYENRLLAAQDFNNDLKDAGDMGAGHTVTALFEVVPHGVAAPAGSVDPLRYQPAPEPAPRSGSPEMLTLKVRYKDPDGTESKLLEAPLQDRGGSFATASQDFRFAASVAAFGMILRDSPYKGAASLDAVLGMAEQGRGADRNGYREEFIGLVRRARAIRDLGGR